jgi:hypothetical protein
MKKMTQTKQADQAMAAAPNEHASENKQPQASGNRRDALRRIGKYSAFAIPALLALTSKPAAAYP